jgi:hypothetical protein
MSSAFANELKVIVYLALGTLLIGVLIGWLLRHLGPRE